MARTPLTRTPLARTLPLRAVTAGRRPLDRPGTVPRVPHGSFLDAVVDWALYADGRRQPPQAFETACETARTGSGFLWLGLHEPTAAQLEQLGTTFQTTFERPGAPKGKQAPATNQKKGK